MGRSAAFLLVAACLLQPSLAGAQGMSGDLIGTVRDAQGGVLPGATVRVSSPALIGGTVTSTTNEKGQLRFQALPPGVYTLDVEMKGFAPYRVPDIGVGAGSTIDVPVVLTVAGSVLVVVEGTSSRIDARDPGYGTRFSKEDLQTIPTRRASMFDWIRAAPGISPSSPTSGTSTTVSAFGSGTNENQFLFDGTNFTCPCNGVARSEPGVDFIQEIQVQSIGASAEFGNVQGAVINVVTRQGSERFQYDASYYSQMNGLTSQPVMLPLAAPLKGETGYERVKYRDFTTNLGGPVLRERLWFFAGYQHLRDYDSQPGTDAAFPRTYDQDKVLAKLTWKFSPNWQLMQSFHDEFWVNAERPTAVLPYEATVRPNASVPAVTFAHLTHTVSPNTLWDVRVGRFHYSQESPPSTGITTTASRRDTVTGVTSGAPPSFGELTLIRTNVKATVNHYKPGLWGADHQWRFGGQVERGEHHAPNVIPTGVRFEDNNGQPSLAISRDPVHDGGLFITAAAFISDAITVGDRVTINAGVRFDHSQAISQDLHAIDSAGQETDAIISGLGTMYTWNVWSPRLGATIKLTADGRTILRSSYGRFTQGVLTGEIGAFHPGVTPTTTYAFESATGGYTRFVSTVDPRTNLRFDPDMRAPRTDEFSVGIDREIGSRLAVSAAYVLKVGANFIGWTDIGGRYQAQTRTLPDGRVVPVFALVNSTADRQFLLTNPDDYSTTYNGLVLAAEKRRSSGWQVFGSYTFSRVSGLQVSSGATAAAPQVSSVAGPIPNPFGQDPNSLTNARGLLPNDRPHVFRLMGSVDVPKTGLAVAGNLQYYSGKPWAATAQVGLPQGPQRIMLETRGSRRLSSQALLDLRISRPFTIGGPGRVELFFDVLNALNDTAEEAIASDNLYSSQTFGVGTVFIDPRRVMLGVRLNLGR
jgi:hypothetical protein